MRGNRTHARHGRAAWPLGTCDACKKPNSRLMVSRNPIVCTGCAEKIHAIDLWANNVASIRSEMRACGVGVGGPIIMHPDRWENPGLGTGR